MPPLWGRPEGEPPLSGDLEEQRPLFDNPEEQRAFEESNFGSFVDGAPTDFISDSNGGEQSVWSRRDMTDSATDANMQPDLAHGLNSTGGLPLAPDQWMLLSLEELAERIAPLSDEEYAQAVSMNFGFSQNQGSLEMGLPGTFGPSSRFGIPHQRATYLEPFQASGSESGRAFKRQRADLHSDIHSQPALPPANQEQQNTYQSNLGSNDLSTPASVDHSGQHLNYTTQMPSVAPPSQPSIPSNFPGFVFGQPALSSASPSEPPSAFHDDKMLHLTDLSTIKTDGKHPRLIVNVLPPNVQPLMNFPITIVELNTFNPNWNQLRPVSERCMQNGIKPSSIATIQLAAGLPPLNAANELKVNNKLKKQHSKVGLEVYGKHTDGRWSVERAEKKGPYNDLTANGWSGPDNVKYGHVKLSDIYDPIAPQHWPSGNDRGVTTKCLEWARANRQQYPDLTTRDWDWLVARLGPLATTPVCPAQYANLDEEAKARLEL